MGILIHIAVFQNVHRFLDTPGTQVNRHHDFGICLFGPVGEFVQTELIAFHHVPGQIQPLGPVFFGAHSVFPPVAGDKVAAGIANHGHPKFLDHLQRVLPEALLVGQGAAGLIDAAVDSPTQMLDERAVDTVVYFADLEMFVDMDGCLLHGGTSL